MGTLLLCNGLYLILFVPFEYRTVFPFFGVTPFIGAISLASYNDLAWKSGLDAIHYFDFVLTWLVSLGFYGLIAAMLTYSLVADFDDVIDRPRTFDGRPRPRRPRGRGVYGPTGPYPYLKGVGVAVAADEIDLP
jgi:hypothetical protein